MKTRAVSMVLLMIASALAGCASGDPDGDGDMGIDTDMLNDLIEDNLQDFINNTSVTVHQEIHYHNNTTVVNNYDETNNEYQNTTNVDGGEINNFDQSETNYNIGGASFGEGVNGSVSGGSMIFVAHLEFTGMDLFPDYELPENPQLNSFSYTYTYYDYLTNSERTDTFNFACSVFYIVGSQSNSSSNQVNYWQDNDNYYNAWEQTYNSTVADLLQEAASTSTVRSLCYQQYLYPLATGTNGDYIEILSIDIPEGYAIEYIQYDGNHRYTGCDNVLIAPYCYETDDGNGPWTSFSPRQEHYYWNHSEGPDPMDGSHLYGGWENISIEIFLLLDPYWHNQNCYDLNGNWISSGCWVDRGDRSVWPSSEYEFTLYYRFVPVIPVE